MKQFIAKAGRALSIAFMVAAAVVGSLIASGTATAATGKPNAGHFSNVTWAANIIPRPTMMISAENWRGREEAVLMVLTDNGNMPVASGEVEITVNGQRVNGNNPATDFFGLIPAWDEASGKELDVTARIGGINITQTVYFKMVWVRDLPGGVVDASTLLPQTYENIMVTGNVLFGGVVTSNPQP